MEVETIMLSLFCLWAVTLRNNKKYLHKDQRHLMLVCFSER